MTTAEIRKLRIELQSLLDYFWLMFQHSRETELAFTHIQFARMWMGKSLQSMGEPNPYADKDGKRAGVEDVEEPADTDANARFQLSGNQVQKADQLREYLKPYASASKWMYDPLPSLEDEAIADEIWTRLQNARMSLGLYMQELKSEHDGPMALRPPVKK